MDDFQRDKREALWALIAKHEAKAIADRKAKAQAIADRKAKQKAYQIYDAWAQARAEAQKKEGGQSEQNNNDTQD